ncbi:11140_t:CDS:2 [Scutellospora calospora]|uniref:11140_t:CDS:1 n=1 Tax=Scutellospora calospora TaxID=85575 RepID=A0ACA9LCV7_9GLOM|nr:11140_t:CDS:2 [Scutellospora calospora]
MPRINRYEYGSTIWINIDQIYNLAVVNIYHYLHSLPEAMEISSQIRDYIIKNSLLMVSQLYNNIKEEQLDGLANDQLESARQYIENNSSFKLLYQNQHSLAFLTPLLFILPNKVTKTIVDHEQITAANKIWIEARIQLCYWHITRQENYPLLEVKNENAFADLPENLHTIVKNLNSYELIVRNEYEDNLQANNQEIFTNQVYEQQKSITVTVTNLNEKDLNIDDNQDLILFQTRKKEIFNLLDETRNILEKNVSNSNKWLDSIKRNFEPL